MTVDEFFRWDKHVGALSKKISSAISCLKIAGFLRSKALINIYYTLVESKLRYCNTVWGNCNLSLKRKRRNLQNRAVRIVSKDYSSPVEEVFTNLKLLNVQQLIDFETATLIYKSQHNLTSQYISDMFVLSGVVHSHNTRHSILKFTVFYLYDVKIYDKMNTILEFSCSFYCLQCHFKPKRHHFDFAKT